MAVLRWEFTPWYLRILGWPHHRRRVGMIELGWYWEYYDASKHGRGLWV